MGMQPPLPGKTEFSQMPLWAQNEVTIELNKREWHLFLFVVSAAVIATIAVGVLTYMALGG